MDTTLIILLCVVLGGLSNTFVQFLSTILKSTVPVQFDQKYLASFGLSMIATVMAAFGVFLTLPIPADMPLIYLAVSALLGGYAVSNVTNLGLDTYQKKKTEEP